MHGRNVWKTKMGIRIFDAKLGATGEVHKCARWSTILRL